MNGSPTLYALAMCVAAMVVFTSVGIIDRFRIRNREQSPAESSPATTRKPSSLELTLTVDACCLEAFIFAITSAAYADMLDWSQAACCHGLIQQIGAQVSPETKTLITVAAKYAAQRHEDRQQRRLYQAIVVSPSRN